MDGGFPLEFIADSEFSSSMLSAYQRDSAAPNERLIELAEILALGLTRLPTRKSSEFSADHGESSLHFSPHQSGGRSMPENGEQP
jgi:hypothetical protein